jgi:hypothetical protein
MIGSLFVRWVESGNGSTLSGRRLASALINLSIMDRWGRSAGFGIIAVAMIGVVVLAVGMSGSRHAARICLLCASLPVVALAGLAVTGTWPVEDWAIGPVMVVAGVARDRRPARSSA